MLYLLWAIVVIVAIVIEAMSVQLISIWFAVGAFFSLISALFHVSFPIQCLIFVMSSLILLVVTFPLGRKFVNFKKTSTNVEMNVGKFATVIENINPENGTGRVKLNGVDWIALSSDGKIIPKGATVIVNQVQGAKLIVTQKDTVKVS